MNLQTLQALLFTCGQPLLIYEFINVKYQVGFMSWILRVRILNHSDRILSLINKQIPVAFIDP